MLAFTSTCQKPEMNNPPALADFIHSFKPFDFEWSFVTLIWPVKCNVFFSGAVIPLRSVVMLFAIDQKVQGIRFVAVPWDFCLMKNSTTVCGACIFHCIRSVLCCLRKMHLHSADHGSIVSVILYECNLQKLMWPLLRNDVFCMMITILFCKSITTENGVNTRRCNFPL